MNTEDSNLIIKDDSSLESFDLTDNINVRYVNIDNCPNLKDITLIARENLVIIIRNCPNLNKIWCNKIRNDYIFSDYLYIGKNVGNLETLKIQKFKCVEIELQIFDNLTSIEFNDINLLKSDFSKCNEISKLHLNYCSFKTLVIESDKINTILINGCDFDKLSINGKLDNLKYFELSDTIYDSLDFKNTLTAIEFIILTGHRHFKSIPLPDKIDKKVIFYFDVEGRYASSFYFFISSNDVDLFKRSLADRNSFYKANISEMDFDPPEMKKCAKSK